MLSRVPKRNCRVNLIGSLFSPNQSNEPYPSQDYRIQDTGYSVAWTHAFCAWRMEFFQVYRTPGSEVRERFGQDPNLTVLLIGQRCAMLTNVQTRDSLFVSYRVDQLCSNFVYLLQFWILHHFKISIARIITKTVSMVHRWTKEINYILYVSLSVRDNLIINSLKPISQKSFEVIFICWLQF